MKPEKGWMKAKRIDFIGYFAKNLYLTFYIGARL
jgi:hypothetical protein